MVKWLKLGSANLRKKGKRIDYVDKYSSKNKSVYYKKGKKYKIEFW